MTIEDIIKVCKFLGIKTIELCKGDYPECAVCGSEKGFALPNKTDDGYSVSNFSCSDPYCNANTILYCKFDK